jgi:hypothetical protein
LLIRSRTIGSPILELLLDIGVILLNDLRILLDKAILQGKYSREGRRQLIPQKAIPGKLSHPCELFHRTIRYA